VIILEPIFPISQTGKPGTIGDIYAPSDTSTFSDDLGSGDSFNAFLTAAHTAGMKVLLTWVSGSIGNDSTWVTDHPDWLQKQGTNFVHPASKPYSTLLDYSSVDLKAELITEMINWATNFSIDGFVSANASAQPVDLWDEASYRVNLVKPEVFLTQGQLTPDFTAHSFAATLRAEPSTVLATWSKGTATNVAANALVYSLKADQMNFGNISYLTDYNALLAGKTDATRFGAWLNAALAFEFVAPGAPMLQAGQDFGYAKVLKQNAPDNLTWPAKATAQQTLVTKLAKLRSTNPVIVTGVASSLPTSAKTVFAFKVSGANGTVVYAVNLTKKAATVKLTLGSKLSTFDFATGKKVSLTATPSVSIPASGFAIYSTNAVK